MNPVIVFLAALFAAWLATPGAMVTIALVLESRLLPLRDESRQFAGFFPGDLFLGMAVAFATVIAVDATWRPPVWVVVLAMTVTFVGMVILTAMEARQGLYSKGVLWGPTKLYHNVALYWGYAGVGFLIFLTGLMGAREWAFGHILLFVAAMLSLVMWVLLQVEDAHTNADSMRFYDGNAHGPWRPIWTKEGRELCSGPSGPKTRASILPQQVKDRPITTRSQ